MSTMHEDDAFERLLGEVERMDESALDALVASTTASYNAPPARPPVDAMWAHIAAARKPAVRGGIHVQRWQLLAASVAFVAFGITIGRQWTSVSVHAAASAQHATPATSATPQPTSTPPSVATTSGSPAEPTVASTRTRTQTQVADATPSGSADEETRSRTSPTHVRSHAAPRVESSAPTVTQPRGASGNAAYQLATMRHFVQAEALLASYDGSAHDAKTDAQLASWASDLLSQTRLLLDSPAGRDPVRRRLLQDLELVLVQMAQLGPGTPQLEHDLIDGSVRHNDIITRLRSAVPAGATTAL